MNSKEGHKKNMNNIHTYNTIYTEMYVDKHNLMNNVQLSIVIEANS